MASKIATLAVKLTLSAAEFATQARQAGTSLGGLRSAYDRVTNSASAYKSLSSSVGQFKLAGRETLSSFQTTLSVARSELRRFARNKDVKVAVEIGRELLSESWIHTRSTLQRLADRSGITVAARVVADRSAGVTSWLSRQRTQLAKPIAVRMMLARDRVDAMVSDVRNRVGALQRFRAVRIGIAAVNGLKLPAQAALASLGPLRKLAGSGVTVGLRAAHFAFTKGVDAARGALSGLLRLGANVGSALVKGFAVAALGAAALGATALYATSRLVSGSMDAIDANAKLSDRLGLSTESLVGLQHAAGLAGVSNEQLTGGLEKMLRALGGAAEDGDLASNAFGKLGLNAAQLANLPTDQAFAAIAEKLSKVTNASDRATLAQDIFGKSGQQLLPLMLAGADGIKAAQQEAEKLGITYSRVDAAKVEQANDAIFRSKEVLTGVGNTLAIGLSPYIQAAAEKFTELATAGGGLGPKVVGAIEWVAKAVATASDYVQLLPAGFHGFRAGALEAIAGVLGGIDWLGSGIVKLLNLLPGVNVAWTDTVTNLKQGMEQVAGEEAGKFNDAMGKFTRGDNAAAVTKTFDDIRAKSDTAAKATAENGAKMRGAFDDLGDSATNVKKIGDTLADLQKDVDQFGLTDSQKKLGDLKANGANTDQLAQAKRLLDVKDQLEAVAKISTDDPLGDFASKMEKLQQLYAAGKVTADQFAAIRETAKQTLNDKLTEQAKSITDDVKTPLEKYQEEIAKLNELFEQKLITKETFDRASLKAKSSLEGNNEKAQPAAITAVRARSAEAMKLAFDNTHGVQRLTKDEIEKKQLGEQQRTNTLLGDIAHNTKDSGVDLQEVEI